MKLALFHHLSEKDQFSRPRFGKHRQRRLVLEKIRKLSEGLCSPGEVVLISDEFTSSAARSHALYVSGMKRL